MTLSIIKVFMSVATAFALGIFITPTITHFLYKNSMWKKKAGKIATDGRETPIFNELHKHKEVGTPKLGGSIIWLSAGATALFFYFLPFIFPGELSTKLDFLSRNQTWIPFAALLIGAIIGAIDDLMEVRGNGDYKAGGLSLSKRLVAIAVLSGFIGYWFYDKLDIVSLGLPGGGEVYLGGFFILLFIFVSLFMYSGGVIDGLDGLAGGVFAVAFSSYAGIAFSQGQIDLAAFCGAIAGGILSFLWFNIPPARFYMSETGTMALTLTLTVVAFMTDKLGGGHGLLVLPLIAFPLVATTFSDIIQLGSKKLRNGKKVFKIAPLHHHFEAIGWPAYKVTMRFWIISVICGIVGLILGLV